MLKIKLNYVKMNNEIQEGIKEILGKLNYELDFEFITALAERMQTNKGKYPPYNWTLPMDKEKLRQALFRHVMEIMKECYADDGREYGHIEAAACNLMMLLRQLKNGKTLLVEEELEEKEEEFEDLDEDNVETLKKVALLTHSEGRRDKFQDWKSMVHLVTCENSCRYEYDGLEYIVATDDEANTIEDEYLDNIIKECMEPEIPKNIRYYIDWELWKRDARMDGRGHIISSYDSQETSVNVLNSYFYLYRQ
jgi:hypothetical protein